MLVVKLFIYLLCSVSLIVLVSAQKLTHVQCESKWVVE